ncbi:hypothetical protein DVH24_029755, partial [Malus domestica]
EKGGEQNENEDNFDTLSIFGTQIPNEQVQDDKNIAHDSAYQSVENKERNVDIIDIDETEIDRVINDVVKFQPEEAIPKEAPGTSIEQSISPVQIQESVSIVQEEAVIIVGQSISVPPLTVQDKEHEGNAPSVPQLPVLPEDLTIKTRKQQTFYEWLFALLTGKEKWECENSEKELTQEEFSQSQTDVVEY